jgi:hypothetical protein
MTELPRGLILLAAVSTVCGVVVSCSSASSSSSSPKLAVTSPTSDAIARNYMALVHNYWVQEQAADGATNGANVAARVCLGKQPPDAPSNVQLIDPPMCRERAVAILANQVRFLSDLGSTAPPLKFSADDQAFRTQISKAIVDLKALIATSESGNKEAVLAAATAYNNDMFPIVTDALNDVDPSVAHP